MKVVIQRVSQASVQVEQKVIGKITNGLLLFVGISHSDTKIDLEWMIQKIIKMRIFNDDLGKMNLSVQDIKGSLLVISQFTLQASTKKGNRPSYTQAARPEFAIPMYEDFIKKIKILSGLTVEQGRFGSDMKIELLNDGPVTIVIDSKNKN